MGLDHLQWCSASDGDKPKEAIKAGIDSGNKVYVARAFHEGGIIPGKLHMTHPCIYIPYGGEEIAKDEYEVLCGPQAALSWVECSGSDIPDNAVEGGHDPSGDIYYIGRVIHNGTVTVGKVHAAHETCYISYGGDELSFGDYEILVKKQTWTIPQLLKR